MIKILMFAGLAEKCNKHEIKYDKQQSTVEEIKKWLLDQFPQAAEELNRAMIAVNEEYADHQTTLHTGDSVAFIPPVSGG